MAIPSLAMIPSGYKDGKVYSVLPANGDGDFDFSRGSNATRVNKDGLIETVTGDTPRLDYTDSSCPSLLLEPQRSNKVTYSEDFSNAAWTKDNVAITENSTISPDGTLNASLILSTNSNTRISDAIAVSNTFYVSVFVKYIDQQFIQIYSGVSGSYYINFDVKNKLYQGGSLVSEVKFEDYGNGWLRLGAKFSGAGTASSTIKLGFSQSLTSTYGNSGGNTSSGSSIYVWGFQLEDDANYPTSYIPTSGSIATRLADECNNGGNADTFNDSEGVLYAEIAALDETQGTSVLTISGSSLSNRLLIAFVSGEIRGEFISGGGTITRNASEVFIENFNKIACSYTSNTFKVFVNGLQVGTTGTVTTAMLGIAELAFDRGDSANDFYGNVKDVRVYNTALTDEELAELTKV